MSQFIVEGIHDCNSFISPHCTTDIFKKLKKNYYESLVDACVVLTCGLQSLYSFLTPLQSFP